jgi:hypothetical protein
MTYVPLTFERQLGRILLVVTLQFCSISVLAQPSRVDSKDVYTLYRSSAVVGGKTWRLHVATMDAADGAEYNRGNCEVAKKLFQSQPGVTVEYWCERGYFSPK